MSLLYLTEHTSCDHYVTETGVGFKLLRGKKGEEIHGGEVSSNVLVFILSGSALVTYDHFKDVEIKESEFVFLAKSSYRQSIALSDIEAIVVSFDYVSNLCDRLSMLSLEVEKRNFTYSFRPLAFSEPMALFMKLLRTYIEDGANCRSLHDLKLKELFWLLRAYHTKIDITNLFYQIIGHTLEFRNRVLSNYKIANSTLELAQMCGYTRQAFSKHFMKEFGETPHSWMQKRLLMNIRARLSDPDIQLKEIIDEFNISSLPHLARLCKSHFGMTPTELRRHSIKNHTKK